MRCSTARTRVRKTICSAGSSSTLTLGVTPVNDPPVAGNDAASTAINTPVTINVLANDHDVDGDTLTLTATHCP